MILTQPWPPDLDPARVGFKQWTETILRRHGDWDDPTRLDTLTAGEFLAYETAGIAFLVDLFDKGSAAIARHRSLPPGERRGYPVVIHWDAGDRQRLRRLADRKWAHQVWRRDPRFAGLLPKVDATVAEIATGGNVDDRKALLRNLPLLQDRHRHYRAHRNQSLRVFVSGITGQTDQRLDVLLAVAGFTQPRITQTEGGPTSRSDPAADEPAPHAPLVSLGPLLTTGWGVAAPEVGGTGQVAALNDSPPTMVRPVLWRQRESVTYSAAALFLILFVRQHALLVELAEVPQVFEVGCSERTRTSGD